MHTSTIISGWISHSRHQAIIFLMKKKELELGTDATGWYGSGMNDIWEVRKLLNYEPRRFKKKGTYHFSISQIMRDNPLAHIMTIGLRVQKTDS